jgi:hypothetical protein
MDQNLLSDTKRLVDEWRKNKSHPYEKMQSEIKDNLQKLLPHHPMKELRKFMGVGASAFEMDRKKERPTVKIIELAKPSEKAVSAKLAAEVMLPNNIVLNDSDIA